MIPNHFLDFLEEFLFFFSSFELFEYFRNSTKRWDEYCAQMF